jgi:hypothetical protein
VQGYAKPMEAERTVPFIADFNPTATTRKKASAST